MKLLLLIALCLVSVVYGAHCTWRISFSVDDITDVIVVGSNTLNGASSGPFWRRWDVFDVQVLTGSHIAISGTNTGGPAGFIVQADNLLRQERIVSDESWRCYSITDGPGPDPRWTQLDFDDSSWANAQVIPINYWGGNLGLTPSAKWIWRDSTTHVAGDKFYCRVRLPTCAICGDRVIDKPENCDDGNAGAGDGCSASCTIETGWRCAILGQSCTPICGDGLIRGGEQCDDRNANSRDGCNSECRIETGYACPNNGGNGGSCIARCGDGLNVGNERCDDGNKIDGDGCTSSGTVCNTEPGWRCDEPTAGGRSVCTAICGDGRKLGSEECDDGNTSDNVDGCDKNCKIVRGWACPNPGQPCSQSRTACGNGEQNPNEQCDDGNLINDDGCSHLCRRELGWNCPQLGKCTSIFGDGIRRGPEQCDDSNNVNGDGCSSTGVIERGWACPLERCKPVCGDRFVVAGREQCDDGNDFNGDGCNSECKLEPGWDCPSNGGTCTPTCGDGRIILGRELCDEGKNASNGGCTDCKKIREKWVCLTPGSACTPRCGNRILDTLFDEACDDGNNVSGDGCSSNCIRESGFTCPEAGRLCAEVCGDGRVVGREVCDDNNTRSHDGCRGDCMQVEPGYSCDSPGTACCENIGVNVALEAVETAAAKLACYAGYWMASIPLPGGNSTIPGQPNFLRVPNMTITDTVVLNQTTAFCGHVTIKGTLDVSAPIHIAGALTVIGELNLLPGGDVTIGDPCPAQRGFRETLRDEFTLQEEAILRVNNLHWINSADEAPFGGIHAETCAVIKGSLEVHADVIPPNDNAMTLISFSNDPELECNTELEKHEWLAASGTLPGGCSAFDAYETVESTIEIEFHYKNMCTGTIIGISVGAAVGAVVILGTVFFLVSGGSSSGPDYQPY